MEAENEQKKNRIEIQWNKNMAIILILVVG